MTCSSSLASLANFNRWRGQEHGRTILIRQHCCHTKSRFKLGDYKLSQVWYERALKADPNHVLTWNYYGLWQIEQGNREQAEYHVSRIAAICGTDWHCRTGRCGV
jgi:tetratricopeptide (TPR) repeat protein